MKNFLSRYKFQAFIGLTVLLLFVSNYNWNTYLSGWDNLQTELYPWLAVKRAFFSVWEEYQSFGLLAGMAHAADLIRAIFIWLISFVLPQNLIRYFYHFLMLLLGGRGAFELIKEMDPRRRGNDNKKQTNDPLNNETIAFLGALFYMLNLGTVQIFYLPFEPFSTFFAFLPWGIWSFLKLVTLRQAQGDTRNFRQAQGDMKKNQTHDDTGKNHHQEDKNVMVGLKKYLPVMVSLTNHDKKTWLLFFLINLLGTPSFYVQQLFVVYLLILFLIFLAILTGTIFATTAKRWYLIKKSFFLFLSIFLINSFWLLPQLYFLKTSSKVVYEAKANQLATEDVYFQNREKGTLSYFLKLEGFYFDLFDKNYQPLFSPWKNHFKTFWPLQYLFAFLMILGLISSLRKKDYPFIFPFILIAVIFLNATWPISLLDGIIRSNKFLNQIFRSPFTKFIIPYSLVASYFFAEGLTVILNLFQNLILRDRSRNKFGLTNTNEIRKQVSNGLLVIVTVLLIFYSLPSFQGFFISPEMKIKIPKDYFELMDYFKTIDKNQRIALLPEYTFWGWFFHRWGYNGSGFLWYGIEQPIVSRTFDVWSDKSESYFWEMKTAIEAEDRERFEAVLDKHDVDYLIVDYSLLPVVGSMKGLSYDRLENLLFSSNRIQLIKKWKNLALFKFKNDKKLKDFLSLKTNYLLNIHPKIKLTDFDNAYLNYKDYLTSERKPPQIIFPFLELTTVTNLSQKKWEIKEEANSFKINYNQNLDLNQYQLNNFKNKFQAVFYRDENLARFSGKINYQVKNNNLGLTIPKILIDKISHKNFRKENCFPKTECFSYSFPFLSQKYSYLLKIKTKNLKGRRLFFYVLDQTKRQTFTENRLKNDEEYYILAPRYQYGLGYTIVFYQNNYENLKSENIIQSVEFYLFPYENLKNLKLISPQFHISSDSSQDRINFEVKKINYFTYQVSNIQITNNQSPITLYLSQSFHPGWKAYIAERRTWNLERIFPFIFGKEIKDHLLVNNWANGWILSQSQLISTNLHQSQIIIIFWPQYWEFIGFGILIISLITVYFWPARQSYRGGD